MNIPILKVCVLFQDQTNLGSVEVQSLYSEAYHVSNLSIFTSAARNVYLKKLMFAV